MDSHSKVLWERLLCDCNCGLDFEVGEKLYLVEVFVITIRFSGICIPSTSSSRQKWRGFEEGIEDGCVGVEECRIYYSIWTDTEPDDYGYD